MRNKYSNTIDHIVIGVGAALIRGGGGGGGGEVILCIEFHPTWYHVQGDSQMETFRTSQMKKIRNIHCTFIISVDITMLNSVPLLIFIGC